MADFVIPPPLIEPTARRIRVRLGNTLVADSEQALLLIQFGGKDFLPTYYLPVSDVRPGALVDEDDDGGRWAVAAGGLRADGAAWDNDEFPELKGHVTFSWKLLDWYEEDEQVFEHARSPYHRVDTLRSSRRVEVFVGADRVANTIRPLLLFETGLPVRYYLPPADVRTELFTASDTVTRCPWKGVARYLSHPDVPDVAWSYPDPIPENPKIRDLICFYNERVDLVIDGVRQERPRTPFS
jgi:uncharacterized protein (DUF427 family)